MNSLGSASTLVIDAQVLQTDTWHRGIGKYSFELLAHACAALPHERVILLLNRAVPLGRDRRDAIAFRLPGVEVVEADLALPYEIGDPAARKANGPRLDALLRELGAQGADYLILAPFPGGMNYASVFPTSAAGRRMCVVYDLIPLLLHERYLTTPEHRRSYLINYRTVLEADLIFTISQTVADDLAVHLGIPAERLINISGAAIGRREVAPVPPDLPGVGRFVLMPTGQDHRKNNVRGVQGFEIVRAGSPFPLSLVLTSRYTAQARTSLMERSEGLVFVGNVSEAEMSWLFRNAEAVLFPSEIEGLGLPVLEGVEAGVPVVCSDISAFREMSADAFHYFEPKAPDDIARALREALEATPEERARRTASYPEIIERFSWQQTATMLTDGLASSRARSTVRASVTERPRIAVLGPNPQGHSAIGKVIQELHPALSERFDVHYYLEMPRSANRVRPNYFSRVARYFDVDRFNAQRHARYDGVFYHLGNSQFHVATARNALHLPGYAIVHDTFLPYLFDAMVAQGVITPERRAAEERLHASLGADRSSCLASLINNQKGVIVHSEYAKEAVIQASVGPVPCHVLGLPVGVPELPSHFRGGPVRVGLAGILAEIKGLGIIRRLALDERFADVQFEVFGHGNRTHPHLLSLQVFPNVTVTTNVSDFGFQQLLSKLDVLISYRAGYRGETSLATLEAMRHGVVNVVRGGLGWFEELPSDAVVKVESEKELADRLVDLVADADRRRSMGATAQHFTRERHSHQLYASGLAAALAEPAPRPSRHVPLRSSPFVARGRAVVADVATRFRRVSPSVTAPDPATATSRRSEELDVDQLGIAGVRDSVPKDIRRGRTPVRRSRACAAAEFDQNWFHRQATRLGEAGRWDLHRKIWEWCEILQAAEDAGVLEEGRRACGFGVGTEPIPATLAGLGLSVLATDSPRDDTGNWSNTNQYARGLESLLKEHVNDAVVRRQVEFRPFDMTSDPSVLGSFDLVWSSCVVEHLGSPEAGLEFIRRSLAMLRPGGVAVHTTEMELRPRKKSRDYGNLAVYTPEDLRAFLKALPPGHSFNATFRIPLSTPADCHISPLPYSPRLPHLKLSLGQSITTSFALTVVKNPEA